ncbi:aminotransferase class I/II-fold pyridoxal phosphate-dependent enzyme [uncultured Bifidobacterium sp.]|uniref:aminotransferase-like domain-containing protein n=1 Tax=uncultured Bifidobacterium sp. TaxID=165187 RepID=UPI00262BA9E8|nr:aminotransferase class I/II-fold pyridoxal phosphate-dependent enzyme [uncultured Bifidobacterium sp.]
MDTQHDLDDASGLAGMILTVTTTPTPQRIIESITSLAISGILHEGQRLPTVRELAHHLRVSPATVSTAYHALARSGVIRSRGRAGTFVLRQSHGEGPFRESPRDASSHDERPIMDLSTGTPDSALLPDIRPFLQKLGRRKAFVNSYDGPTILPLLESALRRSWPYDPESMTMVSGGGDGLALAIESFLHPGDFAITESPTYPLILDLIEAQGAIPVGISMDAHGMIPEELDKALTMIRHSRPGAGDNRYQVGMIILQPRAQNPTGASLDENRAAELADVVRSHYPQTRDAEPCDHGALLRRTDDGHTMPLVIEDDHSGDIANAFAVSLATHIPQQVIHIRSFSKSHGPDLRLAALSGSTANVDAIITRRRRGAGWVSRFLQEILYEMLTDRGTFDRIISARHTYAMRQRTMRALLERQGLTIQTGDGLNVWIPVADEDAARRVLAAHAIRAAGGAAFMPRFRIGSAEGFGSGMRVTISDQSTLTDDVAKAISEAATATPVAEPTDDSSHDAHRANPAATHP